MPRKQITDKQKEKAWKLYNNDNSISYIARTIGVSYASSWIITEGRKRGFKSRSEYQEHLAQQKGFKNISEYQKHLAQQRGFKSYREYQKHLAQQRGFKNISEYQEHLAQQRGFKSYSEYQKHLAQQKGFKNISEYQEHLAQQKGFKSYREYQEHLGKKRQKKELNTKLSILINLRLKELGKSQKWLANELNITESATSRYVSGKTTPKRSLQEKLFRILRFPYNTLDDLLED